MVAATMSCCLGWVLARRTTQRAMLCASAAQLSQAPLAKNCPEGQRVIAQHLGMAISRAVFSFAVDLTHRGIQINSQPSRQHRRCAHRPRPPQRQL